MEIIIQFVSALAVVASVIYLAKQVKIAAITHKQNHEWYRRIETKKALDSYNRLEAVTLLNEAFDYMSKKHAIDLNEIQTKISEDKNIRVHLMRLLNFYEGLANGVDMGIYEEVIIRETRRGNMIRTYEAFGDFIGYHRRENNERAFIKYGAIVKKWQQEGETGIKLYVLGDLEQVRQER